MIRLRLGRVLAAVTVLAGSGCDLPRDPEGTLDRVQNGIMRVGVIAHQPWVVVASGEPTGVEPALVKEFAAGLRARIEWVPGPEAELMEALKVYQLDLVVGGLTDATPWGPHVALTAPYRITRAVTGVRAASHHVMAVAPGENAWLVRLERFLESQRH